MRRQASGQRQRWPGALLPIQCRRGRDRSAAALAGGLAAAALLGLQLHPEPLNPAAAAPARVWKACAFNDRPLPCMDEHGPDGTVRIRWRDGKAMTYRLIRQGFPISILIDSLGGRWEREILPQGNAVFLNPANGNRILVPLR